MSQKDAKTKYYTEKSIHIKVTLAQHAALELVRFVFLATGNTTH